MEELLTKMEVCMTTLDRIAAAGNSRAASNPGRSGVYVSMVKIDGKPILPPLVSSHIILAAKPYGNVTLIFNSHVNVSWSEKFGYFFYPTLNSNKSCDLLLMSLN